MQSSEQVYNIAQITAQKKKQRNHLKENVKKTIGRKGFVCILMVESLIDKTAWFENSRMPTWRSWRVPILMT